MPTKEKRDERRGLLTRANVNDNHTPCTVCLRRIMMVKPEHYAEPTGDQADSPWDGRVRCCMMRGSKGQSCEVCRDLNEPCKQFVEDDDKDAARRVVAAYNAAFGTAKNSAEKKALKDLIESELGNKLKALLPSRRAGIKPNRKNKQTKKKKVKE